MNTMHLLKSLMRREQFVVVGLNDKGFFRAYVNLSNTINTIRSPLLAMEAGSFPLKAVSLACGNQFQLAWMH